MVIDTPGSTDGRLEKAVEEVAANRQLRRLAITEGTRISDDYTTSPTWLASLVGEEVQFLEIAYHVVVIRRPQRAIWKASAP